MSKSSKYGDDYVDTHKDVQVFPSVPRRKKENQRFSAKELALISVLTSLWIVSQLYLGPVISQITGVHGVTQRVMGWLLMLTLASLTGKFGRVTAMAAIASLATRIIRLGAPYSWFVGLGYALGGLTFDLLFFFPPAKNLKWGTKRAYLLAISLVSGTIALIPYILFKFSVLEFYGFLVWISWYAPRGIKNVALNVLGTSIGISALPQIEVWASKIRENHRQIDDQQRNQKRQQERVKETEKRS
jgi:hypothetical protein